MTLELFDFPDSIKDAAKYEDLGFKVEIDDPVNGIWYVLFSPKDKTDAAGVLAMMESCKAVGLEPNIETEKQFFSFEEGFSFVDKIAANDVYVNAVGTIL